MTKRDVVLEITNADGTDFQQWLLGIPAEMDAQAALPSLVQAVMDSLDSSGIDDFQARFGPKSQSVTDTEDGAIVGLLVPQFSVREFDPAIDQKLVDAYEATADDVQSTTDGLDDISEDEMMEDNTTLARNSDGVIQRYSIFDFKDLRTGLECTEADLDDEMVRLILARNEQYTILHDRFGEYAAGRVFCHATTDEKVSTTIFGNDDYSSIITTYGEDGSPNTHVLCHNDNGDEPATLAKSA